VSRWRSTSASSTTEIPREQELRDFFGLEPYQYLIDLDIAHLTDNYHAELDGQDRNQYVYRQQVLDDTTGVVVDDEYFSDPERTGQVIYRSEPTRVSPRVNVRNFSDPARPRLIWTVAVEEVPPGGLAPVLSLAVIATVVAFCFAFIVPKLGSDNFDAPALEAGVAERTLYATFPAKIALASEVLDVVTAPGEPISTQATGPVQTLRLRGVRHGTSLLPRGLAVVTAV
jgi:hypothetical protein